MSTKAKLLEIAEKIISINPKMRFVGIIDLKGNIVEGIMKKGKTSLESQKEEEHFCQQVAQRRKMRKEFDKQLGPVNFALASRQRAIAMSFLLGEDILYVVSEPDADYGALPKKILKIAHG